MVTALVPSDTACLANSPGRRETDSGLDFPAGDGGTTVVVGKTAGLSCDALKDVVDKAVHDGHSLGGDTGVGVHLLQHLVDVDSIAFLPPPLPLLVPGPHGFRLGRGLLGSLRCGLGWHVDYWRTTDVLTCNDDDDDDDDILKLPSVIIPHCGAEAAGSCAQKLGWAGGQDDHRYGMDHALTHSHTYRGILLQ